MIGDRSSDLARVEFMAVRRQKHELNADEVQEFDEWSLRVCPGPSSATNVHNAKKVNPDDLVGAMTCAGSTPRTRLETPGSSTEDACVCRVANQWWTDCVSQNETENPHMCFF